MQWDKISDIILISSLAVLAVFAILGLLQLFSRKSLKKVDPELTWMMFPLTLMAITYYIFDHFLIWNTRPNGSGEPSFPSTHAMVVATIFLLVAIALPKYVKSKIACFNCAGVQGNCPIMAGASIAITFLPFLIFLIISII